MVLWLIGFMKTTRTYGRDEEKKMLEKIRKSIVAGQIALIGLAIFLFSLVIVYFTEAYSVYPSFWYMCYYYLSMPPLQVIVLGLLFIIGAVCLYPVARHKEKEDEVKNGEAEEDTTNEIVCPNCKQSVPEGSRFCNHCGQNIGGYKKSPKPEKRKG